MTATSAQTADPQRPFRLSTIAGVGRWGPLILYFALAVVLWRPFQYIMYKDEIVYIAIAERYARGDWNGAPNAFWPPLLSWLQAVPLSLHVPTAPAVKGVSVLIGMLAYLSVQQLFSVLAIQGWVRVVFSVFIVPALLSFTYFVAGADLLLTAIVVYYLSIVLRPPSRGKGNRYAIMCGVVVVLAYFCKGYALYVLLLHLAVITVVRWFSSRSATERWIRAKEYAITLVVTTALVTPWVGALHKKYGVFTLGVIGPYNYAIRSPDSPAAPPTTYVGLVRPPVTATVSIWEEPYYLYLRLKGWSPFDSRRAFVHQLVLIKENAAVGLEAVNRFTVLWSAIVCVTLLLALGTSSAHVRTTLGLTLFTILLYPTGYLVTHCEARYLWPLYMLFFALGAFMIQELWACSWIRANLWKWVISAVVVASFVPVPIGELWVRANQGRAVYDFGELLAKEGLNGSNIASNGDYSRTVCLAYRVQAKYYGQPKPDIRGLELERTLINDDIDYYLVWDGAQIASRILKKKKEFRVGDQALGLYAVMKPYGYSGSESNDPAVRTP